MVVVPAPASVDCADDVLPAARDLIDAASVRFIEDPAAGVACRAGCSACCSQPVPVTPAEVRSIRRAIERLTRAKRDHVEQRIGEAAAALRAGGIDEPGWAQTGSDPVARRALVMQYFAQDVACPLLENGVCSVREDRPLACREYLVSSDPVHCAAPDPDEDRRSFEQVVRLRSRTDVVAGFGHVSAEFGEKRHGILALELEGPTADPPACESRSGPRLAQLLTGHRV